MNLGCSLSKICNCVIVVNRLNTLSSLSRAIVYSRVIYSVFFPAVRIILSALVIGQSWRFSRLGETLYIIGSNSCRNPLIYYPGLEGHSNQWTIGFWNQR